VHDVPADEDAARTAVGRVLRLAAEGFAFAGAAVLTAIALMCVWSIVGRWLFSSPVQGDFELVQLGTAVCVAAFLPYCQLRRGNIIVDFFTNRVGARARGLLDACGALLLAAVLAVVAWRTGVGALSVKAAGETSMIRGLPVWVAYALMVPSLALTAVVALHTAWRSFAEGPR
jgi:TRAP-type C4-dicarboxylate transport system permease small subunit